MKKLIILFFVFLTGCWNYKEINMLAITTGIGIDKIDDEYKVSFLIASTDENIDPVVYTGRGKTIYEAGDDAALAINKQLYVNHIELLIVSEEVAREGLNNVIDFLFRYPQVRNEFKIAIAKENSAYNILNMITPLENTTSQNIAEKFYPTTSLKTDIYSLSYNNLFDILLKDGINPVIPTIYIESDNSEVFTYIRVGSLGIFKKDKLSAISNKEESKGITIINNKLQTSLVTLEYSSGFVSLEINQSNTNIEYNLDNDIPKIKIEVTTNATIQEVTNNLNLDDKNILKEMEQKAQEKMISYMRQAISLARQNKTDIFGFGSEIYKKNFKYWNNIKKNWNEKIFLKTEVELISNFKIKDKGTITTTIREE